MIVIDNSAFEKALIDSSFENSNNEFLDNPLLEGDFKRYLLLSNYPNKFENIDSLELFYNRYYWYLKFLIEYKRLYGYNAGLEQQEFKILEEGESFTHIDWGEIERISNELKNESPT